ncbi:MAG: hypothetical protein IPO87_18025 [Flavobacteriales bacterium]|nr:hypothetical protein [Flavobacteriales bacterium]
MSKGFALLDNANDRLLIGGQYTNSNISSVTRMVISGGVGANIKKGFSTVFKNGGEQNDLGVFLKGTFIFNGSMTLGAKDSSWTINRRQRIEDVICLHTIAAKKAGKSWVEGIRAEEDVVKVERTAEELDKERDAEFEKLLGDLSRLRPRRSKRRSPTAARIQVGLV